MAFEYRWNSTSALSHNSSDDALDLNHCFLYELTTYAGNVGTYQGGYFVAPNPPFAEWWFRDPTDGRTAPVALGCFDASAGWAWDRHKMGGKFVMPDQSPDGPALSPKPPYTIVATQQYRFYCERCGMDALVPGSHCGPHAITRTFAPLSNNLNSNNLNDVPATFQKDFLLRSYYTLWRYTLQKHGHQAFLDLNALGSYVDDSTHLGYGP